jgi:GGDEF domain-containing protein
MTDGISEPILFEGKQIAVSASVGIALYPSDDSGIEELIRKSGRGDVLHKRAWPQRVHALLRHGASGFLICGRTAAKTDFHEKLASIRG